MFRETVGVNWLTPRRSEHQINGFRARTDFTRIRPEFTEESNNPTLQSNRATASSTFGVREAPSPVQSPNTSDNLTVCRLQSMSSHLRPKYSLGRMPVVRATA